MFDPIAIRIPIGVIALFALGLLFFGLLIVMLIRAAVEVGFEDAMKMKEENDTRAAKYEQKIEALEMRLAAAIAERSIAKRTEITHSLEGCSLAKVDESLKTEQMQFVRQGRCITVRVIISPTGRVGLDWAVSTNAASPPAVRCRRNSLTDVFTDNAFRGLYVDQVKRGQEVQYDFLVGDGRSVIEEELRVTVRVPTVAQWRRSVDDLTRSEQPPAPETSDEKIARVRRSLVDRQAMQGLFDEMRAECEQSLREKGVSEREFTKRMARLDAMMMSVEEKES